MPPARGTKWNPETKKYEYPAGTKSDDAPAPTVTAAAADSDSPQIERTAPKLSEEAERDEKKIKGMRLRFTEKGGIDWTAHQEAGTKEKLESVLSTDDHVKNLHAATTMYTPETAAQLLDGISAIEQVAMRLIFKFDKDVCKEAFVFTQEQHSHLDPMAARLMNKWLPDYLVKYQDEIMFFTLMTMFTKQQIELAKEKQDAKLAAARFVVQNQQPQSDIPIVVQERGEA